MKNDTYLLMCQQSPVQSMWKSLCEDHQKMMWSSEPVLHHPSKKTWLPRQEDWQEIAEHNGLTLDGYNLWEDKQTKYLWENLNCTKNIPEHLTILWCLFVHKEVYGLVWDWDKKVWRKR